MKPEQTESCSTCGKRLSRKTARLIDGKLTCSSCLFPKLKGGVPEQRAASVDTHGEAAET